jgi:Beta-propeller repeat
MAPVPATGAQDSAVAWSVSGGGENSDMGFAVASDSGGNVIFAGRIAGEATLAGALPVPAGDLDAAIIKFDRDGQLVWARRPGGNGRDSAQDIAIDADGNALVTGYFRNTGEFGGESLKSAGHRDAFIAKYDPNGALVWLRRAGGPRIDEGRGIAADSNGNILVTGGFERQAFFADDESLTAEEGGNAFIAKYAPDGTLLWVRQAGGEKYAWGNTITTDAAGNILVSGAFSEDAAFDDITLKSAGDLDIFIAKYDPDGNLIWAQSAGGPGRDIAYSATTDKAGNVLVSGTFSRTVNFNEGRLKSAGGKDAFAAKFAPDGTLTWATSIGGRGDDSARAIALDTAGNAVLTGSFQGRITTGNAVLTSVGGNDIFMAILDPMGAILSAYAGGGSGSDSGFGIAVDNRGSAYITGSFTATATLEGVLLRSAGTDDAFIAKLNYDSP